MHTVKWQSVKRLSDTVQRHVGLLLVVAAAVGLLLPNLVLHFESILLYSLGLMVFIAGLRIDVSDIRGVISHPWRSLLSATAIIVITPLILYYASSWVAPEYALGVLLIAASPVATAAPAMTSIIGGKVLSAVVLLVLTSVCAPFLMPLFIYVLHGQSIDISYGAMATKLALVVVMPLLISASARKLAPKQTARVSEVGSGVSVFLLMTVIAIPMSLQAHLIRQDFLIIAEPLAIGAVATSVFVLAGWLSSIGTDRTERCAVTLSAGCRNIALATALATSMFGQNEVIVSVLAFGPHVALIAILKHFASRSTRRE